MQLTITLICIMRSELAYMNPELSRASAKIKKFTDFIEELKRVQSGAFNKRISR